jgi:hypothetical protein
MARVRGSWAVLAIAAAIACTLACSSASPLGRRHLKQDLSSLLASLGIDLNPSQVGAAKSWCFPPSCFAAPHMPQSMPCTCRLCPIPCRVGLTWPCWACMSVLTAPRPRLADRRSPVRPAEPLRAAGRAASAAAVPAAAATAAEPVHVRDQLQQRAAELQLLHAAAPGPADPAADSAAASDTAADSAAAAADSADSAADLLLLGRCSRAAQRTPCPSSRCAAHGCWADTRRPAPACVRKPRTQPT